MIRMIIADDEPIMRQGLQLLHWRETGFEVIGIAENALHDGGRDKRLKMKSG